jgi:2-oxoglutarate ferredoxin oxidoreductase subunit delta
MKCKLILNKERCKGCGLCAAFCPRAVLKLSDELNSMGYHYVEVANDKCTGCTQCVVMCPDVAIEIVSLEAKE